MRTWKSNPYRCDREKGVHFDGHLPSYFKGLEKQAERNKLVSIGLETQRLRKEAGA